MSNYDNETIICKFFEVINSHKIVSLDKFVTPNFIWHGNRNLGVKEYKKDLKGLYKAFPDAAWKIEDIFSQNDKVCVRWSFTGTHVSDWERFKASGNEISNGGISICRVVNGRLAEVWNNENLFSLYQQMGAGFRPS